MFLQNFVRGARQSVGDSCQSRSANDLKARFLSVSLQREGLPASTIEIMIALMIVTLQGPALDADIL